MQRIACYSAFALLSMVALVGCSSGWTFANWKEALTFRRTETKSSQAVVELHQRARQLEQLQQYELASEVYDEILSQNPEDLVAQQRLAAMKQISRGRTSQQSYGTTVGESRPVSRETPARQSLRDRLPRISPGSPSKSRSIAAQVNPARSSHPLPGAAPARTSVSKPASKRVPLDQFVEQQPPRVAARSQARGPSSQPGTVNMAELIQQPGEKNRNPVSQVSMTSTASNTLVLPEIIPAGSAPQSEAVTLIDIQKRLSTHPADPSAIETLVQGIRMEERAGCWEISSTLGVLVKNSHAKPLIVDSLTRALVDEEPQMRQKTAMVIASLGSEGSDLIPALEGRLNDKEESVRQAAAFAIKEIR